MSKSWVVIKFGGTSVSGLANWKSIQGIIESHQAKGRGVLIVCSALSGLSNQLTELAQRALSGDHESLLEDIESRHRDFAAELGVDTSFIDSLLSELKRRLGGVACLKELSPKTEAEIMAFGERALTRIATAYLMTQGLSPTWTDATALLSTTDTGATHAKTQYLAGVCESQFDQAVVDKLNALAIPLVMTQGFIASNEDGHTVLLGRGGSDVSAAYLAAKLGAVACEIWTDVAGVYTANPRSVPQARIIKRLQYDEAQEIALMGGKVLHPNTLAPLKKADIPLWIKKTTEPGLAGTCVSAQQDRDSAGIKCISVKKDVLLISIEGVAMWRSVGFLVDAFACFKKHGLSIDLLSTAESCVTVSLDRGANLLNPTLLNAVLNDLNQFASASVIGPCASVSLVGTGVRSILSDLSGVLEQFQSHKIYLLTQAASDLNLTVVVDEERADRLCQQIHHVLIENQPLGECFELSSPSKAPDNWLWYQEAKSCLDQLEGHQFPCYFYSRDKITSQVKSMQALSAVDRIFYATKANSSDAIMKHIHALGVAMECVSPGEIEHVLSLFPAIDRDQILFTPNFASRSEYEFAFECGVHVTLDSTYPLEHWPACFEGQSILLRIDPGQGKGHHKHVMTAGVSSKFGIPPADLSRVAQLASDAGATVIGLHAHAGSGVLSPSHWSEMAYFLADFIELFPDVHWINCGGGLGIKQSPWQEPLDLSAVNEGLLAFKQDYPDITLSLEPGRFLVAESGILLARVTQTKTKGDKNYIGIETGMNNLIRPALYGSYHPIVNLTRIHEPSTQVVTVVGPICESGDVLGVDRPFPETKEGDVIAIGLAGAYGESMSSTYNRRKKAVTVLGEHENKCFATLSDQ